MRVVLSSCRSSSFIFVSVSASRPLDFSTTLRVPLSKLQGHAVDAAAATATATTATRLLRVGRSRPSRAGEPTHLEELEREDWIK
ncbi:hypothetical protein DFH11DRAFT_1748710 [Phellopilus nigrolimitatus]|nr:hypothetical protein DFH11DRAFT_1748710 [Phellopilus nigrolimitatus]